MLRAKLKLLLLGLAVGIVAAPIVGGVALAAQSTSPKYQVNEVYFGSGGGLDVCSSGSTGYCSKQAAGETGVGKVVSTPTFVQGNQIFNASGGYGQSIAFNSDVTAGDLLVVAVGGNDPYSYPVTDSQGNTYTLANAASETTIPYTAAIYYAVAKTSGPDNVTMTPSGGWTTYRRLAIQEYRGADSLDVTSSDKGNSATVNTGSAITNHSNELIFGWMISNAGVTSAGPGYTVRETSGSESTMDKIGASPGSYNVTAPTSSSAWLGLMATFYSTGDYQAHAGFNTDREPYIEVKVNTTNVDLGKLTPGVTKTAIAGFSVKTYLASGYVVATKSDPPSNAGHKLLTTGTPQPSNSGTEQFGINLVKNTNPSVGDDPVQVPDNTISFGKPTTDYGQANKFMYKNGDIIAQSNQSSGETDYTISYIFNITNVTPGGTYTMNQVLVATSTY